MPQGPANRASLGKSYPANKSWLWHRNSNGLTYSHACLLITRETARNHGCLFGIDTRLWDICAVMIGGWALHLELLQAPPDSQQCQQPGMHHGRNPTSGSALSICRLLGLVSPDGQKNGWFIRKLNLVVWLLVIFGPLVDGGWIHTHSSQYMLPKLRKWPVSTITIRRKTQCWTCILHDVLKRSK